MGSKMSDSASTTSRELNREAHIQYFKRALNVLPHHYTSLDSMRLTVAYFAISGLDILNALHEVKNKEQIIDWVYGMQISPVSLDDPNIANCGFRGGSFAGAPFTCECRTVMPHDFGHLAMTYTALAILRILGDDLSRVNSRAITSAMRLLQREDGSFQAMATEGERDMRFVYCACVISTLLNDWSGIDIDRAVDFIVKSQNYDFGMAQGPGLESHGGSTYCAIASLALMDRIDALSVEKREGLLQWLVNMQSVGFHGRTNKDDDTCYTYWVGATLANLGYIDLVDADTAKLFIISCESETGGIAKCVDNHPDVLHSYMSLSGLSLLGQFESQLAPIDPALGITLRVVGDVYHARESRKKQQQFRKQMSESSDQ